MSPCGALLLPAFFASTIGSGPRLFLHGAVFYAGLLVVLVPLGIGMGALGGLFATHRTVVIGVASVIMIVFGLLQMFGLGFDTSKLMPGSDKLQEKAATSAGIVKSFLLGMASGVAGFCAGPILGAVLTLAAAQGNMVGSGILLGVYGLGMVVPLLLIAALWEKGGTKFRTALRGKTFRVFGREFHSTSVIGGLLIVAVGILFWTTNGLVNMPQLLPAGATTWLQTKAGVLANVWVDIGVIAAIGAVILLVWMRKTSPKKLQEAGAKTHADEGDSTEGQVSSAVPPAASSAVSPVASAAGTESSVRSASSGGSGLSAASFKVVSVPLSGPGQK